MAVTEAGAPVKETIDGTAQIVDSVLFAAIATTSSTTVTAGSSQTITVASGTGIVVGMWLTIGAGAALETVQVTAVSGTSVTAFFVNVHSGTYNVVANVNRQIVSVGSPSVQSQIAEVDAVNRLNTITPDISVTGQTLSGSATTNNNVISNSAGFSIIIFQNAGLGGTAYYTIEGSIDGTNWNPLYFFQIGISSSSVRWAKFGNFGTQGSDNGIYYSIISGYTTIRIRCGTTGTGSITYAYTLTNTQCPPISGGLSGINLDKISGSTFNASSYASDGLSTGSAALPVIASLMSFDGTNQDRIRKEPYANGPLWTTDGGGSTKVVAAAAGTTVVKGSAGRLCKVLVTTLGATALTLYDNATTTSGNIIGYIPASATAGTITTFDWPAANGITGDFLAGSPAVSISYW